MLKEKQILLTDRERDVVSLVAEGLSAKETAQELNIAPRTVERHLENCRLKFNARNRIHLVVKCMTMGVLCAPELPVPGNDMSGAYPL